jgi:hypothetical protein
MYLILLSVGIVFIYLGSVTGIIDDNIKFSQVLMIYGLGLIILLPLFIVMINKEVGLKIVRKLGNLALAMLITAGVTAIHINIKFKNSWGYLIEIIIIYIFFEYVLRWIINWIMKRNEIT